MKHLAHIDALRGYAILGVIMVHATMATPGLEWPVLDFAQKGQRGVQLFFVVSALTLMLSWRHRNDGTASFLVRRVFRIAPMFWVAIVFFALLKGQTNWHHLAASATFVHDWYPTTIMSTVPGGWSIGVEMTFYLLFPLIALYLRSWRSVAVLLVAAILIAPRLSRFGPEIMWPDVNPADLGLLGTLWLPKQLPVFLTGILVFHLLNRADEFSQRSLEIAACVIVALILLSPFVPFVGGLYPIAALFGALTYVLGKGGGRWLVSRPVQAMGKISYSGYLMHFALLACLGALKESGIDPFGFGDPANGWVYFVCFYVGLVAATAACSAVTYHYVEKPGIAAGRWVAMRFAKSEKPERVAAPV